MESGVVSFGFLGVGVEVWRGGAGGWGSGRVPTQRDGRRCFGVREAGGVDGIESMGLGTRVAAVRVARRNELELGLQHSACWDFRVGNAL